MSVNYVKIDFEARYIRNLFVFIQNRCYINKIVNNSIKRLARNF